MDLLDVLTLIWRGRWSVIASALIAVLVAAGYGALAKEWYRAEVVVVRADKQQLPSLGQLGGLAALAGVNLEAGADPLAMVVLNSREMIREFIEDNDLVHVIFADRWDAAAGSWKAGEVIPEVADAVEYFRRHIREVIEDARTGEIRIGIRWTSPGQAAEWANRYVEMVNSKLRVRALEEGTRNVGYLLEQIAASDMPALQQALGRAVEAEMQKVMLARGGSEYAFVVVDRAVPPRLRESPRLVLLLLVGLIAGSGIGVCLVLFRKVVVTSVKKRE